jgi:hypothetical protein
MLYNANKVAITSGATFAFSSCFTSQDNPLPFRWVGQITRRQEEKTNKNKETNQKENKEFCLLGYKPV